jgi:ketosteroid isomerase-like protein
MAQTQISNLDRDGEVRAFKAHGRAVVGSAGGAAFLKGTFEPGWKFSTDVGPIVGTTSCQTRHLGYVLSGRMHVVLEDGGESEIGPGDMFDIPAGHDAWVVGDEPAVMVDTSPDATRYAKGGTGAPAATSEDRYISLVRKGYEAFNAGDVETLVTLFSHDVLQHVPGASVIAGDYKGIEAVLGYYGKLGELTDGTFRADLIETHGDGHGHVTAVHQITATRNGVTRVSRGSILFTFLGDKMTDLLELHADLAGDDAFLA